MKKTFLFYSEEGEWRKDERMVLLRVLWSSRDWTEGNREKVACKTAGERGVAKKKERKKKGPVSPN